METIKIKLFETIPAKEYTILARYKEKVIISEGDCIQVYDPVKNTLFIVALDDSKMTGKRVFV